MKNKISLTATEVAEIVAKHLQDKRVIPDGVKVGYEVYMEKTPIYIVNNDAITGNMQMVFGREANLGKKREKLKAKTPCRVDESVTVWII